MSLTVTFQTGKSVAFASTGMLLGGDVDIGIDNWIDNGIDRTGKGRKTHVSHVKARGGMCGKRYVQSGVEANHIAGAGILEAETRRRERGLSRGVVLRVAAMVKSAMNQLFPS